MKILIVDDSAIMRNIVKHSLTVLGYPPEGWREAANGEVAWTLIQAEVPDVVLLDWNMPDGDGLTLLKRMRADPRFQKVSVIMTTSEHNKSNVVAAVRAGANEFLAKPIREDQLGEKLLHIENALLLDRL